MSESFYVGALKDVENALLQNNLKLKNVGGISPLHISETIYINGNIYTPGGYCLVDVTVIVPVAPSTDDSVQ